MNTTQESKVIKNKIGLLKLAQQLDSVSKACKVMGFSRDSFYRFKEPHSFVETQLDCSKMYQPTQPVRPREGGSERKQHAA